MANLHRVVFTLAVLFSAWIPCSSYAAETPASLLYFAQWPGAVASDWMDGPSACGVLYTQRQAAGHPALSGSVSFQSSNAGCYVGTTLFGGVSGGWRCPAGSTTPHLVGGVMMCTITPPVCTPPAVLNATQDACINNTNYCQGMAGKSAGTFGGAGGTGPKSFCDSGTTSGDPGLPNCLIKGNAMIAFGDAPNQEFSASMSYTGDKCAASAEAPSIASPSLNCPVGQKIGQVNGEDRCYKPGPETSKTTTAGGTKTTTNPDGTGTKVETSQTTTCNTLTCTTVTTVNTTPSTAGGVMGTTVSTSSTNVCNRGAAGCQTTANTPVTTTTTNSTTGTTTTGQSTTTNGVTTTPTGSNTTSTSTVVGGGGGSFDSGNGGAGGSGGDGEGGMFAGVCGSPPICDGDAVLCAVAAATFATECVLKNPNLPTPLYDDAITKTGDQTTTNPNNSTVSVAPSQFDQTSGIGAAGGMSDLSITVMGTAVVLPLSMVNIWLARLGIVLQACTFLLCARIVVRG